METNPDDAKNRLRQGLEDRRLFTQANPDGTADLLALQLAPHRVASVNRRINGIALQLNKSDETRAMDQIRADVFIDLLIGDNANGGQHGGVEISVDLKTLAELSESAGELAGFGPVIADIARQVAMEQKDTQWRTKVLDENGQVVHAGITRRRPDARLKREILANYPTCTFPGCRMPATECDIDHRDPWSEGGATSFENNGPRCRHDHFGRHQPAGNTSGFRTVDISGPAPLATPTSPVENHPECGMANVRYEASLSPHLTRRLGSCSRGSLASSP